MSQGLASDQAVSRTPKGITRREFVERGGAALLGTALAASNVAAAPLPPSVKPATGMRYRRLGRTNIMISELGLGCASGSLSRTLGPFLFEKWLRERGDCVNQLLDLGGNFISTNPYYHNTEELIGKATKHRRDEIYYAIGVRPARPEKMRTSVENSLRNLQTDAIDLAFSYGSGTEEGFETLHRLRDEGKIRFIGMSGHDPRKHEWAIRKGYLDWIEINYNRMGLIKQGVLDLVGTERVLALAKAHDVGVIAQKVMTGNFIPGWAKETCLPEIQEMMRKLHEYGSQNLYQALLRWSLQNENVDGAVVGMDTPQQVVENAQAVRTRELTAVQKELLDMSVRLAQQYPDATRHAVEKLCRFS